MKVSRNVCYIGLSLLILVLAACSSAPTAAPVTYQTVSEGKLKPGSVIPPAVGPVVLTIDGKISHTNSSKATAEFDMATLESIGMIQYKVDDPFVKKNILYSGVLLDQLLKVVGTASDATTLTLWALDDYSTDMKISDASKWPVIVATKADGAYMPIDKNGPLISVFPFNDFPEIDHLTYDSQWLWALAKITVK
jgi:hypothetical protein